MPRRGGNRSRLSPGEIPVIPRVPPRGENRLPFSVSQAYSSGKFTPLVRHDTCQWDTRFAIVDSSSIDHREEDLWDRLKPS